MTMNPSREPLTLGANLPWFSSECRVVRAIHPCSLHLGAYATFIDLYVIAVDACVSLCGDGEDFVRVFFEMLSHCS
jgi:hypothetical protein